MRGAVRREVGAPPPPVNLKPQTPIRASESDQQAAAAELRAEEAVSSPALPFTFGLFHKSKTEAPNPEIFGLVRTPKTQN